MASSKAGLKRAKAAIDAQQWNDAISEAEAVLEADPKNYFAKLFLGRAHDKCGRFDEAVKAYQDATKIKLDEDQAWLGLRSLYEARGSQKVDEYVSVGTRLAEIYMQADDQFRCQTSVEKVIDFIKKHGTRAQYMKALEIQLPDNPIYEFLEGRLPHPSYTFVTLADLTEVEENERVKREIEERRTRIGARISKVTAEVKLEVYGDSTLESLYKNIIDWHLDDEIRRQYEEKLFRRVYDVLLVLPQNRKAEKREEVLKLANGLVILKHPFILAWQVELEWKDVNNISQFDINVLKDFMGFFPTDGLSRILRSYLQSPVSPFKPRPEEEEDINDQPIDKPVSPLQGDLDDAKSSALACRLAVEQCMYFEEYGTAVSICRQGIKCLQVEIIESGLQLQNNLDSLNTSLATSLTYHQAPRHHLEARSIFNNILSRKPNDTAVLMGIGYILEEEENYAEAIQFLSQAAERSPDDIRLRAEIAWCKVLTDDVSNALEELEDCLREITEESPKLREFRALLSYRIGICLWEADKSAKARKDRTRAYSRFLAAIKLNIQLAPAYTSLGIYYDDYAKDEKRSRQCFQKAIELSATEVVAAERLARSYANEGDWDIVEVIATRVIDSGITKPSPGSKKKSYSWPFSALGVVQLNRQEYASSITSFLQALRISPDDYHSYVGLGESYYNSGRYNSAAKALQHAQSLENENSQLKTEDVWFTKYMLANVNREIGDYAEAIPEYREVLADKPKEYGVSIALLQTCVESGWQDVDTGYYGRAARTAADAIAVAKSIIEYKSGAFNLWKAVGDLCSIFSFLHGHHQTLPMTEMTALIGEKTDENTFGVFEDDHINLDSIGHKMIASPLDTLQFCAYAGILAQKRALNCTLNENLARAVGWYNLGWAEYRAHTCLEVEGNTGDTRSNKFLKAAARCFKRAIELEAGNAQFWNALGVATTSMNVKIAQHSFVRSLHINERNAFAWTNLGILYLLNDDIELAHKAFARAQATDPDYAYAWVGEGMIAMRIGDANEAYLHFTHAFEISGATSTAVKQSYGVAFFHHILQSNEHTDDTKFLRPLFALQQLQTMKANTHPCRHIAALLHERVGEYDVASSILAELCETAESDYETSESSDALANFALAKVDLARGQFAMENYTEAIENAELALDLLSDTENWNKGDEARRKCRLSAHLTAGLAHYNVGQMDRSIDMFRDALKESNSSPDIVCLLSKVLWAKGGNEERAIAIDQLLACAEAHPDNADVLILLGATAVLNDDKETIAAVHEDLYALRTHSGLSNVQLQRLLKLLKIIATVSSDTSKRELAVRNELMTSVVLAPSKPQGWAQLADTTKVSDPANMAVRLAHKAVPPNGWLSATDLAKVLLATKNVDDTKRASFIAPWLGDISGRVQQALA